MVIEVRPLHSEKAQLPMDVTELGMVTEVQAAASRESTHSNGRDGIGDGDGGQAAATVESTALR